MRFARLMPLVLAAALLAAPTLVQGAAQRTFVASSGVDANPCSVSAPCRSIQAALAVTNPGGEVIALDSAGYGPFTVSRSVSVIAAPGIHAGISVLSGTGVNVFAGETDVVVLRGLAISGLGGVDGIVVNQGKEVHIENCTISGMNQQGIRIPGGTFVRISGTTLRQNGLSGVWIPPTGSARVLIENTRSVRNGQIGYFIQGASSRVTIVDSHAVDNVSTGLRLDSNNSSTTSAVVTRGEYSGNGGAGMLISASHGALSRLMVHGVDVSRNASSGLSSDSSFDVNNPAVTNVQASINASHVTWNGGDGVSTGSFGGNTNWIVISRSTFSENGIAGIHANGGPQTIINVSGTTATRNSDYDFYVTNAGTINSFQNNALTGNASDIHVSAGGGAFVNKSMR